MAAKPKLSDKQFLEALKRNDGRFTETAGYIKRRYNIKYSRQAVHERAYRNFAQELRDMRRMTLNEATTRLSAMVADENCDKRLRAKVAISLLMALTKHRK